MAPRLIIVHGLPATGKTTLARRLAHDLQLPLAGKDMYKETLFDVLGWRDRAWSQQVGRASIALLFQFMESQLRAGCSCLVECNFTSTLATPEFVALRECYPYKPIQILCCCDGDVLLERFKQRAASGERHPGHVDHESYNEIAPTLLRGTAEPLHIGGQLIEVDTTVGTPSITRHCLQALRKHDEQQRTSRRTCCAEHSNSTPCVRDRKPCRRP